MKKNSKKQKARKLLLIRRAKNLKAALNDSSDGD
jgi:hypothetical protein